MTTSISTSKRVLSVAVALATMAWAIGLATLVAPLSVSAATIPSGSLVKGSLPAVYYVGANGKRFVFPNDKVYKTWYSDFSTVQTISDADLASLMIGGNVTYRPGFKMLKIQSDPKTYAVSKGGVLRWVKTEAAAVSLYGSDWNKKIDDISDVFFINYTVDGDINSASDFMKDQELANASSINADKNLGTSNVSAGVQVSVANSSPSSMSVPSGAFYAPLLTLAVKNTSGAAVNLTGLTVHKTGILGDSSVSGLLVTDGSGILHGTLVTFGQAVAQPGFASDPIRIAAGATENVTLSVNVSSSVFSGTVAASISAAADVQVADAAGASIAVGGSFPISGSMMNIVSGTSALGGVSLSANTLIGGSSSSPIAIDQGVQNLDVAKFRISESSGNENVELMNLELQNNGSASATDFSNIRLIDQDGLVVGTVAGVINNVAKFSIMSMTGTKAGPHGGYLITSGQQRDFTVRIDTSANTNSASRTVNFTIQNSFRVRAVGLSTGVGVTPSGTFPVGDGLNWVAFRSGSMTVSRATESLSGKLSKGMTNVALATFDIRAFGEPVEVQEVGFQVRNAAGAYQVSGATSLVGTLKINNANGSSIFTKTATDPTLYGSAGCTSIANNLFNATCSGAPASSTLSSFYTIPANGTGKLVFMGDIAQGALQTDGYTIRLESIKFRKVSSNTFSTLTTGGINGNGLSIETSSLTVNKSSAYNPTNLVMGGSLQKIGSFDLQSGAAEGQRVNTMNVQVCLKATAVSYADCAATSVSDLANVSNITLMQGSTQLAPPSNISSVSGGTFSTQLQVAANTTQTVDVYGVVSTALVAKHVAVALTATSYTGLQSQTSNSSAAVLGQDISVSTGGSVSFSDLGNDGVVNVAKLLHASETDVPLFKFKIRETSNAEAMTVGKVYLAVQNAQNTFSSYKLYNEATGQQIGSANNAVIASGTAGEVRFGGLSLALAKGGEMNLIVKGSTVDAATVASFPNYNVTMGVSFIEYTGSVSGTTTRIGGGMAIGQSDVAAALSTSLFTDSPIAGGNFLMVNDVSNFSVCDAVQVDADNSGTFASVNGFAALTPVYVKSVNANTISFGAVGTCVSALPAVGVAGAEIDITGTLTNGARISKFAFTSQNVQIQEVEPTITGLNVGSGNMTAENEVGTFVIRNDGNRSLIVEKLRFEISGSWDQGATYGPRLMKLDRADPTTGARISNTLNGGSSLTGTQIAGGPVVGTALASGAVVEFDFTAIPLNEEVGAGSSKAYVVLSDTTHIKNTGISSTATTQVRMLGSKAAKTGSATDGLVWGYTRTSDSSVVSGLSISDSYIVSGKSLTY